MPTADHPLDARVHESLLNHYQSLAKDGQLLSKERLSESYALFRNHFGPEKLKSLDGEDLLNTIHGRGEKDSLVYWLEFKNDTEFPTRAFGSIKGGNSLKFGIAKKKDTGEWTTGNAINPRVLTIDEAVTIARRHRDQLLAAVEALRELTARADDKTYLALQNKLSQVAPDVCDVAWGHKYLHLLFPDKLDDYHVDLWQRHHLLKLLLLPASKSGLFTCAGQFVRVANQFGWPMNHLTAVLNERDGNPIKYWRIGTKLGEGPDAQDVWPDMKAGGYAAIGWAELGDLSSLLDEKDAKEKIAAMLTKEYTTYNPSTASRKAGEIRNFASEISERDIVLAADGSRIRGVGLVKGPYRFDSTPPEDAPHRRQLEWHDCADWKSPVTEGLRTTVCRLKDDDRTLTDAESRLLEPPLKNLAAPFNQYFDSFKEADWAFDFLKETMAHLGVNAPDDTRVAITLPKRDNCLRLNFCKWVITSFFGQDKAPDRAELALLAGLVDLPNKGKFTTKPNEPEVCLYGLPTQELRSMDPDLRAARDKSLAFIASRFSKQPQTEYRNSHQPKLMDMVFDKEKRAQYLAEGITLETDTISTTPETPPPALPALNTILYGPPGTGKTYHLRNTYMEMFTDRQAALTPEETASALVQDLAWWEVAALALLDTKDHKASVVQILGHPLVRARLKLSSNKNPTAMLWATLQIHTKEECLNVKYSTRTQPLIFEKDNAAVWSVDASLVATILPRLTQLLQEYQHPPEASDVVQTRYEFVTFHQSFSYEDFIEGIKPDIAEAESDVADGHISYRVQPRIFKRVCREAAVHHPKPYALFIDEINRGNVASIFGELITLIEDDKRIGAKNALTAKLPYSGDPFGVPNNLYIIGTMNTADRSVEALDTALRRRFVFVEIKPNKSLVPKPPGLNVDLPKLFEVINDRLETLLDHDHCIGHAYFMDVKDFSDLTRVFANKVIPLLREYFYGNPAKIGLVIGDRFISQKAETTKFAAGDWGLDGLDEKSVFHFTDQSAWKEEDFASIYA